MSAGFPTGMGAAAAETNHDKQIGSTHNMPKDDKSVTLINPFTVPSGKLDDAIRMWEQARDFLQQEPGYISTALHKALAPDARYQLINVAKWESL